MYKVCIADDEEFVLESVRWRIQQSVIELEIAGVARNGIEAYELYEKVCPDIYFVDVNMPLCSGLDFVERVRNLDKNSITKFIIISGYDDFKYMKKAIHAKVSNYILKPIQQQEFTDTLKEVCASLDEIKRKQYEEYGRQWEYFRDFAQRKPVFSGTAVLLYEEGILGKIQKTEDAERFAGTFPHKIWTGIRFHESDNLALMLGEDIWLNERKICDVWEKCGQRGCYLVYKTGKNMDAVGLMWELESTLNVRFWNGSLHLLAAQSVEKQPEEIGLEDLDRAIEDLREEKWQGQLNLIFDKIFESKKNRGILCDFYHSVLILAADKYRQHNFDIPENLKRELYPYALDNCADQGEIRNKINEYIKLIHGKIVQDAGRNDLADQAAAYLEVHYTEDISLSELANEFFVAPGYLAKKFKEKLDITVMQYLENCRMKSAERLLVSTDMNVTEIARSIGYNDANYFTRVFKKKYGMSPRDFRNGKR